MNNRLLDIRNLTTEFKTSEGTITAINNVSLAVNKGEVVGIVGESGCGKSVTSLSVMRLIPKINGRITNGEIVFNNMDLLQLKDREMRKVRGNDISMIFQEPMTALNPVYTVGFQIGEALENHTDLNKKAIRSKTIELLQMVRIPRADKVIDEYPHQLSGGMRQRVMIAMAISCNPKLLIADEPTTALDVTIQAQILELMKELKEKMGMGIIFITHDLNVICEMADRVIVMYGGRVIEEAGVNEIFENPLHCYTRGLMDSRPSLLNKGEQLRCIRGMVPSLHSMPIGCTFEPRCDYSMDICKNKMPDLFEYKPDHKVRCWRITEGTGENNGK